MARGLVSADAQLHASPLLNNGHGQSGNVSAVGHVHPCTRQQGSMDRLELCQDLVWWDAPGALKYGLTLQTVQAGCNISVRESQLQRKVSLVQHPYRSRLDGAVCGVDL